MTKVKFEIGGIYYDCGVGDGSAYEIFVVISLDGGFVDIRTLWMAGSNNLSSFDYGFSIDAPMIDDIKVIV